MERKKVPIGNGWGLKGLYALFLFVQSDLNINK